MNYVFAVLSDRLRVEEAFSALENEGLPTTQFNVVGAGYKSAEELGFPDPRQQARKLARLMSFWLVPFGFVSGYLFNASTNFELFDWAGSLGNHLIGGLFGAIAGAMGGFFIGGGIRLTSDDSDDPLPYRDQLKDGKYILIVSGPPNITNQATRILRQLKPENIQSYVDPTR